MEEDFEWLENNLLEKIEGALWRFLKKKGAFRDPFQAYSS